MFRLFGPLCYFEVLKSPLSFYKVSTNFRHVLINYIFNSLIFFWTNKLNFINNNIDIFVLSLHNSTGNCKSSVSFLVSDVVPCKVLHFFVNGSQSIYDFTKGILLTLNVLNPIEHAITSISKIIRSPQSLFCYFLNVKFVIV